MFGLTSLLYVRDYVQGLHNQWTPSASALEKDEVGKNTLLGFHEFATSNGRAQGKENVEVEASRTKLGSSVAHESSAPRSSTCTPLGFLEPDQNKSCFQNYVGLAPNGNVWTPRDSQSYLTHTNCPHNTTEKSGRDHSLKYNRRSQLGQASLHAIQRGDVGSRLDSKDSGEQGTTATTSGGLTKSQSLPQRQVQSFPLALRNSGPASSPIVHSSSKLRHLSPLRESSGNAHRSTEIEQQNLVAQKTRNGAKSVLNSSGPADRLYQSVVRKSSLKSFLSRRSSFTKDFTNTQPGKYRIPSAPEVRFFWTSQPVYQSQTSTRATSLSSLRHLPPDKQRSLHIGVNNHELFLLPRSNRSSTPTVTYRLPLREERLTPSLTPFSIIGQSESGKLPSAMAPTFPAGAQPSSTLACGCVRCRGSSDVTLAGSVDSPKSEDSDFDDTLIEGGDDHVLEAALNVVDPAIARKEAFFDELSSEIVHHRIASALVATSNAADLALSRSKLTAFFDELSSEIAQGALDSDSEATSSSQNFAHSGKKVTCIDEVDEENTQGRGGSGSVATSNAVDPAIVRKETFFDELSSEIVHHRIASAPVATSNAVNHAHSSKKATCVEEIDEENKHIAGGSESVATSDCVSPTRSGKAANFFEELDAETIEQTETGSVPKNMLSMMNTFQVELSYSKAEDGDSSEVEQTGSYYEFSKSMKAHKVIPVTPMTGFGDESSEETNNRQGVTGNQVRLTPCKQNSCSVLTDHDEAYSCWHPEAVDHLQKEQHLDHPADVDQHSTPVRELGPSTSACVVRNQTHRSVSFAEESLEKPSLKKQFAVYRHSTSLSGPIFPPTLISPRLRGLSFSKGFEEHMLTLQIPPAENSIPFEGRRSSTVSASPSGARSIITLSAPKRKGFWAKVKALFKGCFGAH